MKIEFCLIQSNHPFKKKKMQKAEIPEKIIEEFKYAILQARKDREGYFKWIKAEIEKTIILINKYDKKYVLGWFGSKLIQTLPTLYNQLLEAYQGPDKGEISDTEFRTVNDEIEVLLEYVMSIASAEENKSNIIPTKDNLDEIYGQVQKIKNNINFWELSAEPANESNEFDHWIRTNIMQETINVRGIGHHVHIREIYLEIFDLHKELLEANYGFNGRDIYNTIQKLDSLVYSSIGNPFGASFSHKRLMEWMSSIGQERVSEIMMETGKPFIQQFTEANPDLHSPDHPLHVITHPIDSIPGFDKIFWVIPSTQKEAAIFKMLSHKYEENKEFYEPEKFKAFPLNNSIIRLRPLIEIGDRFYNFSMTLAFRNIFRITENLILLADKNYYSNSYKGNANQNSRDNYLELKTIKLLRSLIPNGIVYHSLKYNVTEKGIEKVTELDVLVISNDTAYIIEVKAGELNDKHKRGALKGLKDRIEETIGEGSYQCHRALTYILESDTPIFKYVENGGSHDLILDKAIVNKFYKISVTFEHFGAISTNLKYLVNSGILGEEYKWAWIVSLYDLMIFKDMIDDEDHFREYLNYRLELYERDDISFQDEIDVLGFYLKGNFPHMAKKNERLQIVNFTDEIDQYYEMTSIGMIDIPKPVKE